MKSFLVKLGKVYKSIRKNGIIPGIRITLMYGMIYLKNIFGVKSGDILFITGGVGDSATYRTRNQAEELNLHGFRCSVTIVDNPFLASYAGKFKVFIFHRTSYTAKVAELIEKIKKQNKEIIFETDDLVFDVGLFHATDSYRSMNVLEKKQYEEGVGKEMLKDGYVKVCTTSTTYLAKILEGYGKKVFLSKNKFSNHELETTKKILENIPKIKDNFVRIGYFSGTYSHNKDFATITQALMEIMEKYDYVKLYLAGPLDMDNALNKFKKRIVILPTVPRDKYYENIWKVNINLYPLVLGDKFCESKSEIRFIETGIMKVPTVAVRNQTYSETIEDGVDGFLADDTAEWVEKIGKLVEDKNLRQSMGVRAREKVLRDYTNKNSHNEEYYNYLKSKL